MHAQSGSFTKRTNRLLVPHCQLRLSSLHSPTDHIFCAAGASSPDLVLIRQYMSLVLGVLDAAGVQSGTASNFAPYVEMWPCVLAVDVKRFESSHELLIPVTLSANSYFGPPVDPGGLFLLHKCIHIVRVEGVQGALA